MAEMKQRKKILIVEDDPYISKMYQLKLNLEGFDVDIAVNGKIGLDKIKSESPDLILLDILMPEIDGLGVLKALKDDPKNSRIPVLVLSNLGREDYIKKSMALGAEGYIVKSHYTPARVVEVVKETLTKHSS